MLSIRSETWRATFTRYAPVFLWIAVIFYFSSDGGSMEQTSRFIRPLLHFLFPSAAEETITLYHGYVRKAAHFNEYALLSVLAVRAFARSASAVLRRYRLVLPVLLAAIIAITDEANQSLESSRSSSVWDVVLDISGAVAIVVALYLLRWPRVVDEADHRQTGASSSVPPPQP